MSSETWFFVAQFIALIAVPQAAVLGLAKFVGLSLAPAAQHMSKILDASAYVTLAVVSGMVIITGSSSSITAPSALGEAITVYLMIFVCIAASVGAVNHNAHRVRSASRLDECMGSIAVIFLVVAVASVISLLAAGVDLGMSSGAGSDWLAFGVLVVPTVVVVSVRWLRLPGGTARKSGTARTEA